MRPDTARALVEDRVEQGAAVAPAAVRRVDDELGHGIRRARLGDLRVPDEGAVAGTPQEVDDAVARRPDREPEGLGDGPDTVGVLRPLPQGAQRRMPCGRRPRGRARCAPRQDSISEKESATSGTKR